MPSIIRKPSRPTTVEGELRITGPVTETGYWRELLNAPGSYNACDVWFQVDGPTEQLDQFRLFAVNGPIRVPLIGSRTIAEAKAIWKDQGGNRWSGILFSVRNRPCDGFKLHVAPLLGGVNRPRSQWRMECWWDCGSVYSDDAGRIMVDPWGIQGDPTSYLTTSFDSGAPGLTVGTTALTGYPEEGGRWDLLYALATTDDPNSQVITLQTTNLVPLTTSRLNFDIDAMSSPVSYQGRAISGDMTGPVYQQGGRWEAVLPGQTVNRAHHLYAEFRRSPAYPQ
jgi:hypothetical protein